MLSKSSFFTKASLITLLLIGSTFLYTIFKPYQINENQIFEVKKGTSFTQIIKQLENIGLVKRPLMAKFYGVLTGKANNIQAGEYELSFNHSLSSLLNDMQRGNIYYRQLRLKEGSTFKEVLQTLKNNPHLVNNLKNDNFNLIYSTLNISKNSLEGLFYPDTYYFKKGDSILNILEIAYLKQSQRLNEAWNERSIGLPFKDSYEALILGSIIEKEGIEKNQIAGVFIRRLRSNMKLQSDPTVIFSLGDQYSGNIKKIHLQMKHPYNTYTNLGLPPGPIGLVSFSSLKAATQPDEGSALYFVSKGDGTHFFSDSLVEHQKAVIKYQQN